MQVALKIALVKRGVRQNRMAVDLGWDPAKLSRIIQDITKPAPRDREAIARYLRMGEDELFMSGEAEVGAVVTL
jgi:transcriptional regulator with XRE-family HTH domain